MLCGGCRASVVAAIERDQNALIDTGLNALVDDGGKSLAHPKQGLGVQSFTHRQHVVTVEPVELIGFRELNQHLGMVAHIAKPQCGEFINVRGKFPVGPEDEQPFLLVDPDPEVERMAGHINLAIISRLVIYRGLVENFCDFLNGNVIQFNDFVQYGSPYDGRDHAATAQAMLVVQQCMRANPRWRIVSGGGSAWFKL